MENIQKTKELHYIHNTNNKSLLRSNQLKTENGREHKQVSQPSDETEIILIQNKDWKRLKSWKIPNNLYVVYDQKMYKIKLYWIF